MFPDRNNLFCDKQVVAADGDSTNVIDLGPSTGTKGRNLNYDVKVFCQLVKDLNASETMTYARVKLLGCATNSATAGDWTVIADSGDIAKANLAAGVQMLKDIPYLVDNAFRFLKLNFDVTGTVVEGITVTGGILKDGVDHITTAY